MAQSIKVDMQLDNVIKCTITQMVQDCESLSELENVFDEICPIKGTNKFQKEYTSEEMKSKIKSMRLGVNNYDFDKIPWNIFTRNHGIRAKCMELFMYEKLGI